MGGKNHESTNNLGQKPTFFIRVLYCQNTSWQGEIQWMEGKKTKRFRSALELLTLIQEAVDSSQGLKVEYSLRTWHDGEWADGETENASGTANS